MTINATTDLERTLMDAVLIILQTERQECAYVEIDGSPFFLAADGKLTEVTA